MPLFRTWLTDIMSGMCDNQLRALSTDNSCATFQLAYFECLEAYGANASLTKCADYYHDYIECGRGMKSEIYVREMRRERYRQVAHGERKPTQLWGPKVPDDAYTDTLFH